MNDKRQATAAGVRADRSGQASVLALPVTLPVALLLAPRTNGSVDVVAWAASLHVAVGN